MRTIEKVKKMTSEAQIQANQLNALQSRGPKDTTKTCFNALKHGILAKELSLKKPWLLENPKEFKQILQFLLNDLKPTSVIESILVERIAVAYWRLRRVLTATDGLMKSRILDLRTWEESHLDRPIGSSFHEHMGEEIEKLEKLSERNDEQEEDLYNLSIMKGMDDIVEKYKLEVKKQINSVPPVEHLDALSRYEVMLEKQLYRAINQLEQMRQKPLQSKLTSFETM